MAHMMFAMCLVVDKKELYKCKFNVFIYSILKVVLKARYITPTASASQLLVSSTSGTKTSHRIC